MLDKDALNTFFECKEDWIKDKCLVFIDKKNNRLSGMKLYFNNEYCVTDIEFVGSFVLEKKIKQALNIPMTKECYIFPKPLRLSRKKLEDIVGFVIERTQTTHILGDMFGKNRNQRMAFMGGINF